MAHLQAPMGLSKRRACAIVGADRKMVRYQSRCPPDIFLRTRLRQLAKEYCRFGYRRLFILLRYEGGPSRINYIYRLFREEGKLRPDEWASGDIHWLVDIVGAPDMGKVMVAQLRQGVLKGKALKLRVKDKVGKVEMRTLEPRVLDAEVGAIRSTSN